MSYVVMSGEMKKDQHIWVLKPNKKTRSEMVHQRQNKHTLYGKLEWLWKQVNTKPIAVPGSWQKKIDQKLFGIFVQVRSGVKWYLRNA
jgi:hypothetical protein